MAISSSGPANREFSEIAVLATLPVPVFVVGRDDGLLFVNSATEQLFQASATTLCASNLQDFVPHDSPMLSLVHRVRRRGYSMSEYDVALSTPRIGSHTVSIDVAPLAEQAGAVVVAIHERSIAGRIDQSLIHRDSVRSIAAMAAMLAHEIKNPLAGVRGAAQLLEQEPSGDARDLTRLIVGEVDRICKLIDRFEIFSDRPKIERGPVNIHEVLEHVIRLLRTGGDDSVKIVEAYDPSLPPVYGDRDQLIQIFLNLVKNAVEAVPRPGGEVVVTTSYQQGIRLALPGAESRIDLPLMVSVQDNGDGIPERIRRQLFDPFVTTKANGSGLGLALVGKLVAEHGGMIDVESGSRRTVFRVRLPVTKEAEDNDG